MAGTITLPDIEDNIPEKVTKKDLREALDAYAGPTMNGKISLSGDCWPKRKMQAIIFTDWLWPFCGAMDSIPIGMPCLTRWATILFHHLIRRISNEYS